MSPAPAERARVGSCGGLQVCNSSFRESDVCGLMRAHPILLSHTQIDVIKAEINLKKERYAFGSSDRERWLLKC